MNRQEEIAFSEKKSIVIPTFLSENKDKDNLILNLSQEDKYLSKRDELLAITKKLLIGPNPLPDYVEKDGIKQPQRIRVIWHSKNGDLIYFDSNNVKIEYH